MNKFILAGACCLVGFGAGYLVKSEHLPSSELTTADISVDETLVRDDAKPITSGNIQLTSKVVSANTKPEAEEIPLTEDDVGIAMLGFESTMSESNNPASDAVAFLNSDTEGDENKRLLEYYLSSEYHPDIEENLVKHLTNVSDADVQDWVSMLQLVSISSDGARTDLIEALPLIENKELAAASIAAITPSLIDPTERDTVLSSIANYATDDDVGISTAALSTISNWSGSEYEYLFQDALSSTDDGKRMGAISAINQGMFVTSGIKSSLFEIMNNNNNSMEVRQEAFSSLRNSDLDEQQYWQYFAFHRDHVGPSR